MKEGHEVSLAQVMEIARLEVSTQQHLDRMQETAKVNYVQCGKSTKNKKGKKSTQSDTSGGSYRGDKGHGTSSKPSGKYVLHNTITLTLTVLADTQTLLSNRYIHPIE